MKKLYIMVSIFTLLLTSFASHADTPKIVSMKTMSQFNLAVMGKIKAIDKSKQAILQEKFNAINANVFEYMKSAAVLKPTFVETIKLLKQKKALTKAAGQNISWS